MKNVMIILKKELRRFFCDPRLLISVFVPGVLVFVIYSLLGGAITSGFATPSDYKATVLVQNMPTELESGFNDLGFVCENAEGSDAAIEKLKAEECDLYIVFPENFSARLNGGSYVDVENAPEIIMYYNGANINSDNTYGKAVTFFNALENSVSNVFNINKTAGGSVESEDGIMTNMIAMLLPFLVLLLLFTGCMSIAPESIAGEKERGTIAILLITPIKRSELALGKIISLSIISLLCGISSFVGTIFSIPKLYGGDFSAMANVYSLGDYVMILGVILSTVLLFVSVVSVISAFAKSVKEATGYVVPLMAVIMLIGITTFVFSPEPSTVGLYFIPIYNSVFIMQKVFEGTAGVFALCGTLITILMNLAVTCALVALLSKMFSSEKVMFSN